MADLTGPRILGGLPPTALPAQPGGGERPNLAPGTRVEVRLLELLGERGIRLRLDPAPAGATATAPLRAQGSGPVVTAQLVGALPSTVPERIPGRGAGLPMLAEVTRTEPRLEVRLLPLSPAGGAGLPVRAAGTDNSVAQWLGQQLRQHLPAARPLAPGLQALLPPVTESRRSDTPATPTATPPARLSRRAASAGVPARAGRAHPGPIHCSTISATPGYGWRACWLTPRVTRPRATSSTWT